MSKAVFCITKNLRQAEHIIQQLQAAGFPDDSISVLYGDIKQKRTGGLGHEKHTKAPEGAAVGAIGGGLLCGTIGLLAGVGALAIPGIGPFIAAGPIMAALAGTAVGGSIGLIAGALVGLGIPEYEAVHYAEKLKDENNILISVHLSNTDDLSKASEIFEDNRAEDIAYSREVAVKSVKW